MSDRDEVMKATDELRYYAMRKTMERKDPWLPESIRAQFSEYAIGLIELLGNDEANRVVSEAVITALGKKRYRELQQQWIGSELCWIDMCANAIRAAGKETP